MTRDIIGILDSDGNQVVSYIYDSWGKLISTSGSLAESVGKQNPFRYAGYYYDQETGFYYIESRYYDPETHRFLNADDSAILTDETIELVAYNLFAYTKNNPVNLYDPDGNLTEEKRLGAFITAGALAGFAIANAPGALVGAIIGAAINVEFYRMALVKQTKAAALKLIAQSGARMKASTQVNAAVSYAVAKARSRVALAKRNVYKYFEIWFDKIGAPIFGKSLNKQQAITRVRRGLNVITYYSSDALYVANMAGGAKAMWHQKHGGAGYFNHYHINGHKNSAHIYYLLKG